MNYKNFSIRGINPETGRKKTITLGVPNITTPHDMVLQHKYLNEPFEIKEIPFELPTERQLAYANGLGIKIPQDACIEDVSALLSRAEDSDSSPNEELIEYATNKELTFSKYIGKKALYNLVFYKLPELDKIAFFCFSVYRYVSDDRHANLDTSPHRDAFYSFAQQYVGDKKFINSILKYEGKDLRYFGTMQITEDDRTFKVNGGSINTIAYKTVSNFLHEKFNTPLTQTKVIQNKIDSDYSRNNSYSKKADSNTPKGMNKRLKRFLIGLGVIIIIMVIINAIGNDGGSSTSQEPVTIPDITQSELEPDTTQEPVVITPEQEQEPSQPDDFSDILLNRNP